jgi:hypothetical protein
MWAQGWGNIYDLMAPKDLSLGYDLTAALEGQHYDAVKIAKTAENFYTSMGFAPLPQTFWERSMLVRPRDREVDCHPIAWDIDDKEDVRVSACLRPTADDFYTAHHELGHDFYMRAYQHEPYIFKGGANDGFHEAIGDFIGLYSVSPSYLKEIGLIDEVPGPEADIPYLLLRALDKIAFLPFAYIVDKWRWQVFAGEITPDHYNDGWWALRTKYQGIVPPGPRPADAFDPGAKYHIVDSVPYARYFLAEMYQFIRGSAVVAIEPIEAGRIEEQLARLGEACLASEVQPGGSGFGQVAGGHVMVDLAPLLRRQHGPGGPVHAPEAREIPIPGLALCQRRLVDHQEARGRGTDGLKQAELAVALQMMDRQAAPGGTGGLGSPGQSLDEVAMVELDLVSCARQILRRELERGLGKIDAMVVADLGAGERLRDLARVAAGNVEKGKGLGEGRRQRIVQDLFHRLVRQRVGVHQLLVGRPLLLELLQRGCIVDGAVRLELTDRNVQH